MPPFSLSRRLVAEGLGTAFLVAIVVGSGIMGERLSGGNVAIALLANTIATGAGLYAVILITGPISGGHLNPVVTLAMAWKKALPRHEVAVYVLAQVAGGFLGTLAAHGMFREALIAFSTHARDGSSQLLSEGVATLGLLLVIGVISRSRPLAVPSAVGLYIVSAYWFTASTSFANPAVTIARSFTDTFAGIRPTDVLALSRHSW